MDRLSRRGFLKTGLAASAGAAAGLRHGVAGPLILQAGESPTQSLRLAFIGLGGRGGALLGMGGAKGVAVAAYCDCDRRAWPKTAKRYPDAKPYVDYRKMFDEMARDIGAMLFGEDYELPKQRSVVEVDAAELEPLVGEYRLMGGTVLAVTLDGGKLYIQEKGADDRQELLPVSASEFFLKYKDLKITFKKDSAGDVVSMVLNIGGRIVGAKKIE